MTDFEHGVGVGMLLGGGKSKTGYFRAIMDDNTSTIKIVLENNGYSDNTYSYEYFDFSDEIKTQTTSGETTTTTTRTFTQRIITQLVNPNGELILGTEYNSDTGVITRYYDGTDTDIHLTEWRTETVENTEMSTNADAAAVAWCIARNLEQSSSLKLQKKAYKDGLKQGIAGGADITERYEQDGNSINLTTGENGGVSEPFIGNFTEGIYCHTNDGSYVCIRLDMSLELVVEGSPTYINRGKIVYDAYDANGSLLASQDVRAQGGYYWENTTKWQGGASSTYRVEVLNFNLSNLSGVAWSRWRNNLGNTIHSYWENPTGQVAAILKNVVRINNFPPETMN